MKIILPILVGFVLGFSVMFELEVRSLRQEAERQAKTDAVISELVAAQDAVDASLGERIYRLERILDEKYEERATTPVIAVSVPATNGMTYLEFGGDK